MWLLLLMLYPNHWEFYIQGSRLALSFSGTWSYSMFKVNIALQDVQTAALLMCGMTLSGKMAELHLDNNIVKAYLCN